MTRRRYTESAPAARERAALERAQARKLALAWAERAVGEIARCASVPDWVVANKDRLAGLLQNAPADFDDLKEAIAERSAELRGVIAPQPPAPTPTRSRTQ